MILLTAIMLSAVGSGSSGGRELQDDDRTSPTRIALPAPRLDGQLPLEQALAKRRSVRQYARRAVALAELSQLCWAAQGTTSEDGRRSAPSAGATYPLELVVVAENVSGLKPGIYRYRSADHSLTMMRTGSVRESLAVAALSQDAVRQAPVTLVLSAVSSRTTTKYGGRGTRYIHMESGHAAQNVALQAVALGLGSLTLGAFRDDEVNRILGLPQGEESLYLLPVGHPSQPNREESHEKSQ